MSKETLSILYNGWLSTLRCSLQTVSQHTVWLVQKQFHLNTRQPFLNVATLYYEFCCTLIYTPFFYLCTWYQQLMCSPKYAC